MLAYAYDRVSTLRQAAKVDLETRYLEAIQRFCDRRDWTLRETFTDAGLSGKNANRPGLQAAIAAAIESRGIIIFYDLSRFSRSMQDLLAIADTLKQHGAALASATEAIDTSDDNPASQLTFHVIAACAEFQRRLIGAKVRESNRRRVQELGHRTQGTCPAGFQIINGNRVPNLAEQAVLVRIDELSALEMDYNEVARRLNDEAVLTIRQLRGYRRAGRWTAAGVRRLTRRSTGIAR